MPYGTITSTENTFGTVNGALSGTIAGTLTGSVGVPGPGVPAGGTAGQVLAKVDGVDYNTTWVNQAGSVLWGQIGGVLANQLDLSSALALKAPLDSPLFTGDARAVTPAFGDNDTSIATTAFVQAGLLGGTANAKNLEVYVRNQSGSTIPAGAIVYISGATGNRPLITLAQANNDANSAQTMGFTKAAIANNDFGYVIVRGELENINTSALTEGVQLYLSPTTPGTWTTTKPVAPQHLVYVGIVVRSHPTLGVILVAVQNGYEIGELHDVKLTSPVNGQVLKYDSAQNLWVNGTDSSGVAWGGITGVLSAQLDLQSALDSKQSVSGMTAYLTKADNLGSLTNFATARDNLGLGSLSSPTFAGITAQGSGANVANLTPTSLSLTHATSGSFTIQPSVGITFPNGTVQTTAFTGIPAAYISSVSSPLSVSAGNLSIDLSSYLLSSTAASTYFTIASAAGKANLSGATFTGKVNFSPVAGVAGLNVGIGGTSAASTTQGDLWIASGGVNLNYRDGTGAWRIVAITTSTNTFSSPQIVDTTSSTAALRVTQKGTGNAIEVEDSTTPDATRFVVDQFGKVGVGTAPDSTAALKVDTNGLMFGDGTTQTTAAIYSGENAIADMLTGMVTSYSNDGTNVTINFNSLAVSDYITWSLVGAGPYSGGTYSGGALVIPVPTGAGTLPLTYNGKSGSISFIDIP